MVGLSVIVPFYNVERYAAHALLSLRRSADPDVEFVLVDDASTDTTPALLAEHADRLPRATVVRHVENAGLAAARNSGLAQARGEYLTFLDGDDWVAPGYFPRLLAEVTRLDCDMLRTDHVQVTGHERVVHRIAHGPRGVVSRPREAILPAERVTSVDAPYAWAGVYSRRLLDAGHLRFDEHLRTCEDRPWIWRLHLRARSFAVVGLLGVFYRRGVATSLTQVTDERQLHFVDAFAEIFAELDRDDHGPLLRPKAIRTLCAITLHHLGRREHFSTALAGQLRRRAGGLLATLPERDLRLVLAGFDEPRRRVLNELVAA